MLRAAGKLLAASVRGSDVACRYGGEEFVLILPETGETGAVLVAQRLRRAVEQARFFAGSPNAPEHLTISIGVAIFDSDAQFKRELIEAADAALYSAKHSGRNSVILHSDRMRAKHREAS